jgi:hypothetical protein
VRKEEGCRPIGDSRGAAEKNTAFEWAEALDATNWDIDDTVADRYPGSEKQKGEDGGRRRKLWN